MADVTLGDVVQAMAQEHDAKVGQESAACACSTVLYKPLDHGNHTFSERWACKDCGREFKKKGIPDFIPPDPAVNKLLGDAHLRSAGMAGLVTCGVPLCHNPVLAGGAPAHHCAQHQGNVRPEPPAMKHSFIAKHGPSPLELAKPTTDLPAGMKTAMWIPVEQNGSTYFQCHVEGFGVRGSGYSRDKMKALSYALMEMAEQVAQMEELP